EIDPGSDQEQVRRAGNRDEFGEPFHNAEEKGFHHEPYGFGHSFLVSAESWVADGMRSISTDAMRRPSIRSTVNTKVACPRSSSHRSPASGRWPKRASMKPATVE